MTDTHNLAPKLAIVKEAALKRLATQKFNKDDFYTTSRGDKINCWKAHYCELLAAEMLLNDEVSTNTWVPTQCLNQKRMATTLNRRGLDLVQYPFPPKRFDQQWGKYVNDYDAFAGIDVKYQPHAASYNSISIEWDNWNKAEGRWDLFTGSSIFRGQNKWLVWFTADKAYLLDKKRVIEYIKDFDLTPKEADHTTDRTRCVRLPIDTVERIAARIYNISEEDKAHLATYIE